MLKVWIWHFTGAAVSIQPVQRIDNQRWVWHVGLDSEASALLNDLYDGKEIEEVQRPRLLALFRLEFRGAAAMLERVRGAAGVPGLGDDGRAAPQAQAAQPTDQSAARADGLTRSGACSMNEDVFNMSLRKFLKKVGVTSQREIEKAVRTAIDAGRLKGTETLQAEVTLKVNGVELTEKIDGKIELM